MYSRRTDYSRGYDQRYGGADSRGYGGDRRGYGGDDQGYRGDSRAYGDDSRAYGGDSRAYGGRNNDRGYTEGYTEERYGGRDDRGYTDRGYTERTYRTGDYSDRGYTERGYTEGYTEGGYSDRGYAPRGYYDDDRRHDDRDAGYYTQGERVDVHDVISVGESVDSFRLAQRRAPPRQYRGRSPSPLSEDENGEYRGGGVVERKVQSAPLRPPPREQGPPGAGPQQLGDFQQHLISAFRRAVAQQGGVQKPKETTYVIVPGAPGQPAQSFMLAQNNGGQPTQPAQPAIAPAVTRAVQPAVTAPQIALAPAPSNTAATAVMAPRVKVVNGQPILIPPPTTMAPRSSAPAAPRSSAPAPRSSAPTPPVTQILGADPGYQEALSAAQQQVHSLMQTGTTDPQLLLSAASAAFTSQYAPGTDPAVLSRAASHELARSQSSHRGSQATGLSVRSSQPAPPPNTDPEVEAALQQFERLHSGHSSRAGSTTSSRHEHRVYKGGFDAPGSAGRASNASQAQRFTWSENK